MKAERCNDSGLETVDYGCECCSYRDSQGNCWKDAVAIETDNTEFACWRLSSGLVIWR